mmetsp:Transcript_114402/g.324594  ORF Transcript_114402/g.324594 Transcript_114402/m.324594 type:complete len:599 (+) Transcript_114402:955-2751(+)
MQLELGTDAARSRFSSCSSHELEAEARAHDGPATCGYWIVVPHSQNQVYQCWEASTMMLLFLCCYFVPFDVLVLREPEPVVAFVINTVLDVVFSLEMVIAFRTAYQKVSAVADDGWETDWRRIARRYCTWPAPPHAEGHAGWFWVDAAGTVPIWLMRALARSGCSGSASQRWVTALRVLRLARLLRLARMVDRLSVFIAMVGLSLQVIEVFKFVIYSTLSFHWMACLYVCLREQDHGEPATPSAYLNSAYWALVTLTGVGYGDYVADSIDSYIMCCVVMLVSAFVWAWISGCMISLIMQLNKHADRFRHEVLQINDYCERHEIPRELTSRIGSYTLKSKNMPKKKELLSFLKERLSDDLRRETVQSFRGKALHPVWWARDLGKPARLEICYRMESWMFVTGERCVEQHSLLFVKEGLLHVNLKVLGKDGIWGVAQILLRQDDVIWSKTLTSLECLTFTQKALKDLCVAMPQMNFPIRRAQVRVCVFRGLQRFAQEMRQLKVSKVWHHTLVPQLVPSFCEPRYHRRQERAWDQLRIQVRDLSLEVELLLQEQLQIDDLARQQAALARSLRERLVERDEAPAASLLSPRPSWWQHRLGTS